MSTFPDIADYAFLSDCEVSTLVAPDGSVEWLCLPRPDSPSVFGALLDRTAGFFRFGPTGHRRAQPASLRPRHQRAGDDVAHADRLADRVRPAGRRPRRRPTSGATATGGSRATPWRRARCCASRRAAAAGSRCRPTASRSSTTAATAGEWTYDDGGYERVTCRCGDLALDLTGSLRLGILGAAHLRAHHARGGRDARGWRCRGRATAPPARTRRWSSSRATEKYWRDWLALATIADHPWRPYIERSALALKGLSYAPTGAIMAAGTTSLPETPGGERNWDYRYTWIRDTAFMLARARTTSASSGRRSSTSRSSSKRVSDQRRRRELGPADHVRDRRRDRSHRAHPRPPLRVPQLPAGAHRQRRVRPAPARRVGHAPRRGRHPRARAAVRSRRGVGGHLLHRRPGDRNGSPNPTRASGRCAAIRSTSWRRR